MQRLKVMLIIGMVQLSCYAQNSYDVSEKTASAPSVDIFASEKPLNLTLKFDLKHFQKTKYEGEKKDAELIYFIADSVKVTRNVRIKARGKFRREHCALPPFWIYIKDSGFEDEFLANAKKVKLVNHCNGAKSYSDYVLKEYLTYKLYNLFTPYSFRVRLVQMKYIDTGRENKETEGWAFIIEPEKMLAERLNSLPIKLDNINLNLTDSACTDRLAMFQYMIGNADYSITGRQNIKLLKINDISKPYLMPVPYDFDYVGLINTYYAVPGENLGIESVRDRYYLGLCRSDAVYEKLFEEFKGAKEDVYKLIMDFEFLDKGEKNNMINYLEEFYSAIERSTFIEYSLNSTCR